MVKQFSTARSTQRDTVSYIEKGIWKREIDVSRGRQGGVKRGESSLSSVQLSRSVVSEFLRPHELQHA